MKVATEIWVAAALLHKEHPERNDFGVAEIVSRAVEENLGGGYRPGLHIHASSHCVANKQPCPAQHRMLFETARGRRRLFRSGDPYHPYRERGKVRPERAEVPQNYIHLIEWYDKAYSQKGGKKRREKKPRRGKRL